MNKRNSNNNMKNCYNQLLELEGLAGKIVLDDGQEKITIAFHEYMHFVIMSDYILLNQGLTHWHPEDDEEIIQNVQAELLEENVYIELRGFFTRPRGKNWEYPVRICDSALKVLSREKFEKRKEKYMKKRHLRIYTGKTIIKRSVR